jgi:hypothetical protein
MIRPIALICKLMESSSKLSIPNNSFSKSPHFYQDHRLEFCIENDYFQVMYNNGS